MKSAFRTNNLPSVLVLMWLIKSGSENSYGGRSGSGFCGGCGGRFNNKDTRINCQLCGKPRHIALKGFKRFDVHFMATTSSSPQTYRTNLSNHDYSQEEYGYYNDNDAQWVLDSELRTTSLMM